MRTLPIILLSFVISTSYGQSTRVIDSITKMLENVFETDQAPRIALDSIAKKYGYDSKEMRSHWKNIHKTDSINLLIVTSIIDKYGWLSAKETSEKANEVLFLVIQHADLSTQLKYHPILKLAVNKGKASASDYAYMLDRINSSQGKFQIYGTQFQGDASGNMHLYPVKDEPNVNKRRKKVGLDSLEKYAKKIGLIYKVPKHDQYKNKIVVFGSLADTTQKPLADLKYIWEMMYCCRRLISMETLLQL